MTLRNTFNDPKKDFIRRKSSLILENKSKIEMRDIKEFYLSDLANNLKQTHVKLNLEFLEKLLKNSSNNDKPRRDKKFAL